MRTDVCTNQINNHLSDKNRTTLSNRENNRRQSRNFNNTTTNFGSRNSKITGKDSKPINLMTP